MKTEPMAGEPRAGGACRGPALEPDTILDIRGLTVRFRRRDGDAITVVDDLSVRLERGRALALVGESGSGKSVSMRAVLGLLPPTAIVSGQALLAGGPPPMNLIGMPARQLCAVRGARVGMVFQNAMDAMNPTVTLLRQLSEPLLWHGICDRREAKRRAIAALGDVGIPEPERRVRMYPFQLSGGMRQRAMIAMAMIARPEVLIADEPTTAVDVTVQRQILDLLTGLKEQGTAIIMITHDLGVARYFCDDITVLYAGQLMERARMANFIAEPRHPYSRGLLGSALDVGDLSPLQTIPGQPPDMATLPAGCRFHPRCGHAELPACAQPQVIVRSGDRELRCWKGDTHG